MGDQILRTKQGLEHVRTTVCLEPLEKQRVLCACRSDDHQRQAGAVTGHYWPPAATTARYGRCGPVVEATERTAHALARRHRPVPLPPPRRGERRCCCCCWCRWFLRPSTVRTRFAFSRSLSRPANLVPPWHHALDSTIRFLALLACSLGIANSLVHVRYIRPVSFFSCSCC